MKIISWVDEEYVIKMCTQVLAVGLRAQELTLRNTWATNTHNSSSAVLIWEKYLNQAEFTWVDWGRWMETVPEWALITI